MKRALTIFLCLALVFATLAYAAVPRTVKQNLQNAFTFYNVERMALLKLTNARWPVGLKWVRNNLKKVMLYEDYKQTMGGFFGMFWGNFVTRGVVMSGDYLFAGMGSKIGVFDVSDPKHIQLKKSVPLYGTAYAVAYDRRKQTLYVASGFAGLSVLDISHPPDVRRIGWYILPQSTYARWLALSDPYVYIASERGCLIVDIRNSRRPKLVRQILYEPVKFTWVDGNTLYLTLRGHRIHVYDITQKDKPMFLTKLDLSYPVKQEEADPPPGYLMTYGKYAYVANGHRGVAVLDVSNPAKPRYLRQVYLDGRYTSFITVYKNILDVQTADRIYLLDISEPSKPVLVKSFKGFGGYLTTGFSGGKGIFTTGRSGFHLVDLTKNLFTPSVLGSYTDTQTARAVYADKNVLYLANGSGGLKIYDLADPGSPQLLRTVGALGYANAVALSSNYAFVPEGIAGISIINVSHPRKAAVETFFDLENVSWNIAVANNRAYIASSEQGLNIFDVQNPTKPEFLGGVVMREQRYPARDYVLNVAVQYPYAYLVSVCGDLYFVNVSNPRKPFLKRKIVVGKGLDVVVRGMTAYVAGYDRGVRAVDLKGGEKFEESIFEKVVTYRTGGRAVGLDLKGDFLYVADFDKGLLVFDVTDPMELKLVKKFKTRGHPREVFVRGSYAYVADWEAGLTVVDLEKGAVL